MQGGARGASCRRVAQGTEARNILHGRHENSTIHDEVGMRHYYEAWGHFLGVSPANPLGLSTGNVIAAE